MKLKKIVCFGGGNAMPKALLEPLRAYPVEITSITSMTDDGGSTGWLRKEFSVLPPGDIRRHILAFSNAPAWKKQLWDFRFGGEIFEGGHKGHNFANVFMAGLERNMKNYGDVLRECHDFMEVPKKYRALPATVAKTTLCAELEDGQIIEGESEVDVPKVHDANLKIKKIFLRPKAKAYGEAVAAITKADILVFSAGDLYSSMLACLLPAGMKSVISASKAEKILLCNIMNKKGETGGFSVSDFADETERYMGASLDYVIYNTGVPDAKTVNKSRAEDASVLEPVAFDNVPDSGKFIGVNLLKKNSLWHDPKKTGKVIWKLVG